MAEVMLCSVYDFEPRTTESGVQFLGCPVVEGKPAGLTFLRGKEVHEVYKGLADFLVLASKQVWSYAQVGFLLS